MEIYCAINTGKIKMKVYRVENKEGRGCYVDNLPELEDMYEDHSQDYHNRPITIDDIGRGLGRVNATLL